MSLSNDELKAYRDVLHFIDMAGEFTTGNLLKKKRAMRPGAFSTIYQQEIQQGMA